MRGWDYRQNNRGTSNEDPYFEILNIYIYINIMLLYSGVMNMGYNNLELDNGDEQRFRKAMQVAYFLGGTPNSSFVNQCNRIFHRATPLKKETSISR